MAKELSNEQIKEKLERLEGWTQEGDSIKKEYSFKNFKQAWDFVNQVSEQAEDRNHHPQISFTWGKAEIEITNHEVGGLTDKDFDLAQAIEQI